MTNDQVLLSRKNLSELVGDLDLRPHERKGSTLPLCYHDTHTRVDKPEYIFGDYLQEVQKQPINNSNYLSNIYVQNHKHFPSLYNKKHRSALSGNITKSVLDIGFYTLTSSALFASFISCYIFAFARPGRTSRHTSHIISV